MSLRDVATVVRANYRSPRWWRHTALPHARETVHSASHDLAMRAVRTAHAPDPTTGCEVMAEDWDNLVILDACRFDVFKRYNHIEGALSSRVSQGSATREFLTANFAGRDWFETVYVTAHPLVPLTIDDPFHAMVHAWETAWDQELNTVHPERLTRVARHAAEAFPHKRVIVHYLQPHYPFIGPFGRRELPEQAGVEYTRRQALNEAPRRDYPLNAWDHLKRGHVARETVWRAYCENLTVALPHVAALVDSLAGKTVVTADHGNLFGAYAWPIPIKLYEHPPGVHLDALVTVPWLTVDAADRRDIRSEPPRDRTGLEHRETAADRLRHLGYHP